MSDDQFTCEIRERVAYLRFNRPDKLNALTREMAAGMTHSLSELAVDPDVGAIVVTGAGRAFCAGGDVRNMVDDGKAKPTMEEAMDILRKGQDFSWMLHSMPKVTIAAVNGYAMGAGLGIALSCDLRVASSKAEFGTAYAKVGLCGDYGVTWQITRLLGPAKAKELMFTADVIDAEEALKIGMVNRVADSECFEGEVHDLAKQIAQGSLVCYRYMKENINLAVNADFRSILDREAFTHIRCSQTEDHREGVAAFVEKRAPKFSGR